MKKILSLLITVIFIVMAFMGCATQQNGEQSQSESTDSTQSKNIHDKTWDEIVADAKTQKDLVFFCWWGEDFWTKTIADFNAENGTNVTFVMSDGAAAADKLIAEKNADAASIDVFSVGGTQVLTTMNADVFEKDLSGLLPESDKLDQKLQQVQEGVATNGTLVPLYRNQTGFIYNPDKVKNPPQTWDELQQFIKDNPNRFGICTPDAGGSGESFFQTALSALTGGLDQYAGATEVDPAKVAKWDAVWKWYIDNKNKVVLTKSNADSAARLNTGEIWLTVLWSDDTYIAMSKGELSKNFVFYIPEMGCSGGGDTIGIAANCKNKELALVFVNYLTSKEVQEKMVEGINVIPARTDVNATKTVIKSEEMVNSTPWVPVCYSIEYKNLFLEKVLQQ